MSRTSDGEIQPDAATSAELATHDAKLVVAAADVAGINGDAMRGTDSGALATVATEARLAELDATNIPSNIDDILTHILSYEHWFEKATTPDAELHVADHISEGAGAFQIDAGDNAWSAWLLICGASDTPHIVGSVEFDLHRFSFVSAERNATYFIQVGFGASGAAALSADTVTEAVFHPLSNQIDSGPVEISTKHQAVGQKVWVRTMCPGQDTAKLDFYYGILEH